MQVKIYYDYTCPYSYRAFQWFQRLQEAVPGLEVSWATYSLKEANRGASSPSPFDDREISRVSVLALALAHAARQADFDHYHQVVFDAMQARRLDQRDLLAAAADAGVDTAAFDLDRHQWLSHVAEEHGEAKALGVFGTPTLVFDDAVAFVKLAELPPDD
ncbi:MAG TPA: DsbA family protein, partial [Acidimicrobiales bacterium]|nr:DsbA family protein [Acidimicrobiales bacterium]